MCCPKINLKFSCFKNFLFFLFLSNPTTLKTGLISQNQTVFFRTTEFLVLKCVITAGCKLRGGYVWQFFNFAPCFCETKHIKPSVRAALKFAFCYGAIFCFSCFPFPLHKTKQLPYNSTSFPLFSIIPACDFKNFYNKKPVTGDCPKWRRVFNWTCGQKTSTKSRGFYLPNHFSIYPPGFYCLQFCRFIAVVLKLIFIAASPQTGGRSEWRRAFNNLMPGNINKTQRVLH